MMWSPEQTDREVVQRLWKNQRSDPRDTPDLVAYGRMPLLFLSSLPHTLSRCYNLKPLHNLIPVVIIIFRQLD